MEIQIEKQSNDNSCNKCIFQKTCLLFNRIYDVNTEVRFVEPYKLARICNYYRIHFEDLCLSEEIPIDNQKKRSKKIFDIFLNLCIINFFIALSGMFIGIGFYEIFYGIIGGIQLSLCIILFTLYFILIFKEELK